MGLYTWAQYTPTPPPQSELPAQRCSRLDNKKANTRHTQLNNPREEEGTGGGVIELLPVFTLYGLNGEAELSGHPGKEVEESGKGLRLGAQRKSPRVVNWRMERRL